MVLVKGTILRPTITIIKQLNINNIILFFRLE